MTLAYPEYRGNGVMASLGNIRENPHVDILMIDFARDRIDLHVNGRAQLATDERMRQKYPDLPVDPVPGRRPQMWVEMEAEEAYIHCSKHIPRLVKAPLRQTPDRQGRCGRQRRGGVGHRRRQAQGRRLLLSRNAGPVGLVCSWSGRPSSLAACQV